MQAKQREHEEIAQRLRRSEAVLGEVRARQDLYNDSQASLFSHLEAGSQLASQLSALPQTTSQTSSPDPAVHGQMEALSSSRDAVALASTRLRSIHAAFANNVRSPNSQGSTSPTKGRTASPPRMISPLRSLGSRIVSSPEAVPRSAPSLRGRPSLLPTSKTPQRGQLSRDIDDVYNKADTNGDGVIDRMEFAALQRTPEMQERMSRTIQQGQRPMSASGIVRIDHRQVQNRSPAGSLTRPGSDTTNRRSSTPSRTNATRDWADSLYL